MWRMLILMLGYFPWVYLCMILGFAMMYTKPVIIPQIIILSWIMAYGVMSFLWLAERTRLDWAKALLVPVPVMAYIIWSDLQATSKLEHSIAWLYYVPVHAVGVGIGALILSHRRKKKALKEIAISEQEMDESTRSAEKKR